MAKPTKEQLEKINRYAHKELTEDDVYVFKDLMIDDQATSYYTKIHENLLRKFVKDTNNGIALLVAHDSDRLPIGRSIEAVLQEDINTQTGEFMKTVYGYFYIPLGVNTETGISTDDIIKGIDSGVIFDTSIGFRVTSWKCSICGNDIRDFWNCPHFPGSKYVVEDEEGDRVEICYAILGEDGDGELLENSLVYAGACSRATIVSQSMSKGVSNLGNGTKLHPVENLKDVPLHASIYQYYSKDGIMLFTDTDERTGGAEYLKKRGVEKMELTQVKDVLKQYGIEFSSIDELTEKLTQYRDMLTSAESRVAELETEVQELSVQKDDLTNQLSDKESIILTLTQEVEKFKDKAKLAEDYKTDLIDQAIKLGVRANGNAFNTEIHTKLFSQMSVEELKEVIEAFDQQVKENFSGAAIASTDRSVKNRLKNREPKHRDDFETEAEFRAFVADKAEEYSREHDVSITEATKLMMKKYTGEGDN